MHYRVAVRREFSRHGGWKPLCCSSIASAQFSKNELLATLLLLARNSQIKSRGKAMHVTQNARR